MKKTWETPTLITHGSVEKLTKVGINNLIDLDRFILPDILGDGAFDLFASLGGLP